MNSKKRSTGFILTIFCTFTLLLTACGANNLSSTSHYTPQKHIKLDLQMTVDPTMTTTAPAMTTTTPTATLSAKEMYVGEALNQHAWIGLSSNNNHIVAFVTDGSADHPVTFAQWFKGPVNNNIADLTASSKTGSDRLQAMLTNNSASGTVTLAGGKSFPFTAKAVSPSDKEAGLYRGDATVNGEPYTAGWVVMPQSATSPPFPGRPMITPTRSIMATPTMSPTGTSTMSPTSALPQGGAIINQKTNAVQPAPELTSQEISTQQVIAPRVGTFKLMQCEQHAC